MLVGTDEILKKADGIVKACGTREPRRLARELDIEIIPCFFKKQKGAYKVILRNRFVFIKNDLDPVMSNIVLLHEIGHDTLHRNTAIQSGGFEEYSIFDMQDKQMEYEANLFASHISLPDDEILEYISMGYDTEKIARAMNSDVNLVALKAEILISKGHCLRRQEHSRIFLK